MSDTKKEKIIGIDLGTSNSAASVLVGGKPTVVPSAEGASQYGKAFPSYVAFTDDGQMLVGEPARRQAVPTLKTLSAQSKEVWEPITKLQSTENNTPHKKPLHSSCKKSKKMQNPF